MIKKITAANFLPKSLTLPALKKAAKACKGCPLYKKATQTVFGDGPSQAKIVAVGEIPGNKEDLTGKPFQGPAGTLLRNSLEMSGIDLEEIYFTNVVKHFKFAFLNNKRMHRSPISSEIKACSPWLKAEIEVIKPKIILCLGAVAAKTLVNKNFHLKEERGKWFKSENKLLILATYHPSAILRARDDKSRHQMKAIFIRDLKKITLALKKMISQ